LRTYAGMHDRAIAHVETAMRQCAYTLSLEISR
jgi:hypothetical protein